MRSRTYRKSGLGFRQGLLLGVILVLLLVLVVNLYYRSVQADVWSEERAVRQQLFANLPLIEIASLSKHVWDEVAWVAQGTDEEGESVFVWLTGEGEELELVKASEGIDRATVKATVLAAQPDIRLVRIMPGLLDRQRVWEVFYTVVEEGTERYHYSFYRFDTGAFITTYRLPSKFATGSG